MDGAKNLDLPSRSFAKAVSYRVFGTGVTVAIAFATTRRWDLSLGIGGLDFIAKIALFYGHERAWEFVPWGRRRVKPAVIWFTGLSGAGKTTLATRLYEDLRAEGRSVDLLDGDAVRAVFSDVGFTHGDRSRYLKSMGFIASRLEKNGTTVIASFITPYRQAREEIRGLCSNFVEVYVSTPLEVCEARDVKGLYRKARSGEIHNFTGISDEFEVPLHPEAHVDTSKATIEESYAELRRQVAGKLTGSRA
jgi:adenylylsulfate kinase